MSADAALCRRLRDSIAGIAQRCGVRRVVLFGSRARGDNRERSDIDLAVSGGDVERFRDELETSAPTLLAFDVLDLDGTLSEKLRRDIDRDGVTLHG